MIIKAHVLSGSSNVLSGKDLSQQLTGAVKKVLYFAYDSLVMITAWLKLSKFRPIRHNL